MARCNNNNRPDPPHQCNREAADDSGLCCSECAFGGHTAVCDAQTFPSQPSAQYYSNPDKDIALLQRMTKAVALGELLEEEFRLIRNASMGLGISWGASLESLLAHMAVDLKWINSEVKRLTGV